jgi:hypothetical protein
MFLKVDRALSMGHFSEVKFQCHAQKNDSIKFATASIQIGAFQSMNQKIGRIFVPRPFNWIQH